MMPLVEDKIDEEKGTESRGNGVRKRQIFGEDQMRKLGAVFTRKKTKRNFVWVPQKIIPP